MKLIYVAGQYTAKSHSGIEDNIRKAEKISVALFRLGWAVLTPHKNTAHYEIYEDELLKYTTWIDTDNELLRRSDAIILMKNWEDSKGSVAEKALAEALHIPIFYESNGLPTPELVNTRI